jgi:GrpB-like predicted nucleotidyltransferase (UPF0157 family)
MRSVSQSVIVVPYNENWPNQFNEEAVRIRAALGDNCVAIYHIGSTAIPGLSAKPIIDIIPVVKDITEVDRCDEKMKVLGYEPKGEYGILFRRYFQKGSMLRTHNMHVFQEGNSEIERHLKFRDWMRQHPEDRKAYEELKIQLAQRFPNDMCAYCLGKDDFVANIDAKTGWHGMRLVMIMTPKELEVYAQISGSSIQRNGDTNHPASSEVFDKNNFHIALYYDAKIVAVAHLVFLDEATAQLLLLAIDRNHENKNCDDVFKDQLTRWAHIHGRRLL